MENSQMCEDWLTGELLISVLFNEEQVVIQPLSHLWT